MRHFIIGTAGHVDHGKSTLIKALTGIETDRLPEEQARGLSIDLGFAHLSLGPDMMAGIVDVPGHERFLKNMLAGVGGYDLGLLVVDAGEGVMPQTREHVEILDLLQTGLGVVAITKTDTVDADFLELVEDDLRQFLAPTFLAKSPLVRVSARRGAGLEELKETLRRQLDAAPARNRLAPFRLPIDRAFLKAGFGTVVTGSLWSGTMNKGDRVQVLPLAEETKIRGLQVHGEATDEAVAGQRVAVNLSGVDPGSVQRGMVLAPPGLLAPTTRIDVRIDLLARSPRALKHRARIRFYSGTSERLGRVLLLEGDALEPGKSALAQLLLEDEAVVMRGDRFVLRDFTASYTAGGGEVLDPAAERHRRGDVDALDDLRKRERGGPEQAVLSALSSGMKPIGALVQGMQASPAEIERLLKGLEEAGDIVRLGKGFALSASVSELEDRIEALLIRLQVNGPWRTGWKKDELMRLLDHPQPKMLEEVLVGMPARGRLKEVNRFFSTPEFEPQLTLPQQQGRERVLALLREAGFSPPAWEDVGPLAKVEPAVWKVLEAHLAETGQVVKLAPDMYFLAETLEEGRARLRKLGRFTPAEARDAFATSRKFIIPLLEHYDQASFCQRSGEVRVVLG